MAFTETTRCYSGGFFRVFVECRVQWTTLYQMSSNVLQSLPSTPFQVAVAKDFWGRNFIPTVASPSIEFTPFMRFCVPLCVLLCCLHISSLRRPFQLVQGQESKEDEQCSSHESDFYVIGSVTRNCIVKVENIFTSLDGNLGSEVPSTEDRDA